MFHIQDIDHLKKYRILDCPSGASSFAAEAHNKYGINTIGCDPLFDKDPKILEEQGEKDIEYVVERVSLSHNLYKWDYYLSVEGLRNYRKLGTGIRRYIKAELPKLPFDDRSFDLVLSGHFLFTYAHKFEFSFILSSIKELFRVCSKEVRIYPLQKSSFKPYERMSDLLYVIKNQCGIAYDIRPVPFEFQKGSNKMLCLTRNPFTVKSTIITNP
jgi:hypothetical protein